MRGRMWALIAIAAVLATVTACGARNAPAGTPTPGPIKTLRPTFTATVSKPTEVPTATPGVVAAATVAPEAQATPEQVEPTAEPDTPTPEPSPTSESASFTVSSASLNVRSGPGTNFGVIGRLASGQTFPITGKNPAGSWWEFDYNGRKGWVIGTNVSVAAADQVEVAQNIPKAPTAAAPRPTSRPQPQPQPQPQAPAAPATIFGQSGMEMRNANNTNHSVVTFWGRLGPTSGSPITGYSLKVSAPSGEKILPFDSMWQWAYSGVPGSRFLYNNKVELPRTSGGFRAVVVNGSGAEVSDAITGTVTENTHDVILSWLNR